MGEEQQITKSAGVVSGFTLVSRVFGLIRDQVAAYAFGSNWIADSFYQVFIIPNMLRKLAGEGSLTISFIPVFTEEIEKKGKQEAMKLAYSTFWLTLIFLMTIMIIGMIFAPQITRLIAPGFEKIPDKPELASKMLFEMFPYAVMVCLAALSMAILNSFKHFAAPAANQIFFNIASILAILIINNRYNFWHPGVALVVGVLVGGILQFLVQVPFLIKHGFYFKPYLDWHHPGLKQIGRIMLPSAFAASIYQINVFVGSIFLSGFPGGRTWIYYSDRFIELPRAIFAIAIATVILPSLSSYSARNDTDNFRRLLEFGLRLSVFLIVPATIGYVFLRVPIVSLLLQHGNFNPNDTLKVALVLFIYTSALWATAGSTIMTQSFYALKNSRIPASCALIGMVANVIGCATLTRIEALGFAGVAVSTSAAAILNFVLLFSIFQRRFMRVDLGDISRTIIKCIFASFPMIIISAYVSGFDLWLSSGHIVEKLIWVVGAVVVGAGIYFAIAHLLKMKELEPLVGMIRGKSE